MEFLTINLSKIDNSTRKLVVKMRIDGRDVAGNQFEDGVNLPSGVWELEQHTTGFSLEQSVLNYQIQFGADENTIVQIHVRNDVC